MAEIKNVVIVGGSYAGCSAVLAAKDKLPPGYRIIVIEPRSHFHYTFAFLRASVVPDFERDLFIPYSGLFPEGSPNVLVHAKVSEVTSTHVVLDQSVTDARLSTETTTTIPYAYLIYAAGAKHPSPTEMERISSKEDSVAELKDWQKQIIGAGRIVVVGGGGSGLEIAAEVAERYPRKKVVLVHSRQRYMEAYGEGIHDVIYDILNKFGVHMIFGERVVSSEDVKGGATLVTTTKGTQIEADLVLWCTGLKPQSVPLQSLSPTSVDPKTGFVKVLPTFQIVDSAFPNVFVCGDIADTTDMKLARAAFAQSALVVDNILTLIGVSSSPSSGGAPTLKTRDPLTEPGMWTRGIFMPMGHTGAVAVRLFGRQVAFNSWWWEVVRGKSGENLGADNMWRMLGVELDKTAQ
ncbi:FAD/NAD(P)-binding domain-containing protein [Gonapodya prolifera JEL478]|uniref:FAD/NAD(P)-binding domain-containing protein n=1 Tax=Gonapodya prolifera (strain JEL478) TaxID=1344416 RepID=A0A139A185_GONPJ|nr:FAD/NAD(P)-binding domain-containing protein [Gonapodya prolifera JEL478]|eukprot:KXS10550.1 FAD/NAD(P)-binding domain-containing protein [Gonapodya prolifera JEL478]